MDTRAKIVENGERAPVLPAGTRVVSGFFDPLLHWHAERLEEARRSAAALVVVVKDPAKEVLPARARAELVAALRCVDWVVADGPRAPAADVRLEEEDAERAAAFVEHVRARQR